MQLRDADSGASRDTLLAHIPETAATAAWWPRSVERKRVVKIYRYRPRRSIAAGTG